MIEAAVATLNAKDKKAFRQLVVRFVLQTETLRRQEVCKRPKSCG